MTLNTQDQIRQTCDSIKELLLEKNAKYGDSALNPERIFSKADVVEQIKVRIDDKLSRIATTGFSAVDEDTLQDLVGYLVLLRIALKRQERPSTTAVAYEDVLKDSVACGVGEGARTSYNVSYQDVLQDAAYEAANGSVPLYEYGITVPEADVDDNHLPYWDSDDEYMWDPSLGPVELTEEEIFSILSRKDLDRFGEDEIVSTFERRGIIFGVKKDGSSCILNDLGRRE